MTFRKLLPALYNRMVSGLALEGQNIIIIGRRDYTDETYRERARDWVRKFARLPYRDETFDAFAENIHYFQMDFTDPATYPLLDAYLDELGIVSCVFYFAVAPRFFGTIADGLFQIGNAQGCKVILEKPFGETLEDARALNERLESAFTPQNIYRIDHYLGKEMVRNVQTIRFTNPIFADAWDAQHIASIQISAMEDVGVEHAAGTMTIAVSCGIWCKITCSKSSPSWRWSVRQSSHQRHCIPNSSRYCGRCVRLSRSILQIRWCLDSMRATAKNQMSLRNPRPQPMPRSSCLWTIRVGRICRSISVLGKKLGRREMEINRVPLTAGRYPARCAARKVPANRGRVFAV